MRWQIIMVYAPCWRVFSIPTDDNTFRRLFDENSFDRRHLTPVVCGLIVTHVQQLW
jgi:hypothetical protein